MELAEAIRMARTLSGLTRDELARLAGVPAEELVRLERGQAAPTFDAFDDILMVAGYRMSFGALTPRCDQDGLRAARRILDPTSEIAATAESELVAADWARRGITDRFELARRAGFGARVSIRPGARQFAWTGGRTIEHALRRGSGAWALSADPNTLSDKSVICYVENVDFTVTRLLPMNETRVGSLLTVLPFDEVTSAGIWTDADGCNWTAPGQALIDGFSVSDRSARRPLAAGQPRLS
jgi:transcriptional regulator with XRE-family HTH domain